MNKASLLAAVLSGGFCINATAANNALTFQKGQSALLSCEGFGKISIAEYLHGEDFSFIRLVDDKKQTYYLPFVGGNTAYIYEDEFRHLSLSTDHGDLSKAMSLDKSEWADDGQLLTRSYQCTRRKN